jgi:hypothetical protein
MNIQLDKAERDALKTYLLFATAPYVMSSIGFKPGGLEFRTAMKVIDELKRIGPFDPDCDALP